MQRIKIALITNELFSGPLTCAYLKRFKDNGYELDHVVVALLVRKEDWLKKLLLAFLGIKVYVKILKFRVAFAKLTRRSQQQDKINRQTIESVEELDDILFERPLLESLTPRVQYVVVENMRDRRLVEFLKSNRSEVKNYIYASSQLIKGEVLRIGLNFILCHPGVTTHVAGVCGILWSILYRKKIGFSVIYLDEGVDTGDLILCQESDCPRFQLPPEVTEANFGYVAFANYFLSYYNNQKKADVMLEAVKEIVANDYDYLGVSVDCSNRRQFYQMHDDLKRFVGKLLIEP